MKGNFPRDMTLHVLSVAPP